MFSYTGHHQQKYQKCNIVINIIKTFCGKEVVQRRTMKLSQKSILVLRLLNSSLQRNLFFPILFYMIAPKAVVAQLVQLQTPSWVQIQIKNHHPRNCSSLFKKIALALAFGIIAGKPLQILRSQFQSFCRGNDSRHGPHALLSQEADCCLCWSHSNGGQSRKQQSGFNWQHPVCVHDVVWPA